MDTTALGSTGQPSPPDTVRNASQAQASSLDIGLCCCMDRNQAKTIGGQMSVYRFIDIVGTSSSSWEDAAVKAVNLAKETLRDLRVAEVVEQDLDLTGDEVIFRTRLSVSFKYESGLSDTPVVGHFVTLDDH